MNLRGYCSAESVDLLLDVGPHPICNRFVRNLGEPQPSFPMRIGQCRRSGIICLTTPFPIEEIRPRVDWITYNEPEPHLDHAVQKLCETPGIPNPLVAGGISFKDDSTLARLAARGFRTWRPDASADLGIDLRGAGVESIQAALTPARADAIAGRYGKASILVVRHIFEHVYDLEAFADALRRMVCPGGLIVFEIPDCASALERLDYTALWEEHLYYLTPETFRSALALCGFDVVQFVVYPYASENSLWAVTRVHEDLPARSTPDILESEIRRARRFADAFTRSGEEVRDALRRLRRRGALAILGAGHQACTFLTLFRCAGMLDFVVDDNSNKRGLYLPGTSTPVVSSEVLLKERVAACILAVNPTVEDKVVRHNAAFEASGGRFFSIFPGSPRALLKEGQTL